MNQLRRALKLGVFVSVIACGVTTMSVNAEEFPADHIDSFSFGGSIEGSSKDLYFGFTRYKPGGIGVGAELALYRFDQEEGEYGYSYRYSERDLSLTLPIAATEKIYVTPSIGVRQLKNVQEIEKIEVDETQYEPLYGLDVTYMLDNVSITVGADKSESSDWSITYGLGISF